MRDMWRMCLALWAMLAGLALLGAWTVGPALLLDRVVGPEWPGFVWVVFALPVGICGAMAGVDRLGRWSDDG